MHMIQMSIKKLFGWHIAQPEDDTKKTMAEEKGNGSGHHIIIPWCFFFLHLSLFFLSLQPQSAHLFLLPSSSLLLHTFWNSTDFPIHPFPLLWLSPSFFLIIWLWFPKCQVGVFGWLLTKLVSRFWAVWQLKSLFNIQKDSPHRKTRRFFRNIPNW